MSIDINDLTIGQARQLAAQFGQMQPAPAIAGSSPFIGDYVLIRTKFAGVHIGWLVAKDGTNVLLKDARRIWKWAGAFTLSEIATAGPAKKDTRISCIVPMIELTQAIEIIPISEAARKTLDAIGE